MRLGFAPAQPREKELARMPTIKGIQGGKRRRTNRFDHAFAGTYITFLIIVIHWAACRFRLWIAQAVRNYETG
jgi:hypothetical protein